ncbi:MAG: hypothetical protein R2741_15660 [Methanolobus sp.]
MANLDVQRLRKNILKYYSNYNVAPVNTYELSSDMDANDCAGVIDDIASYLLKPMEKISVLSYHRYSKNVKILKYLILKL